MTRVAAAKKEQKPLAVRAGRPPRELAGEVDERILDAARQMFLERGLMGASIDEIARLARAGKPTIYARFPTKEALFIAVGMRNAASVRTRYGRDYATAGETIEERLVNLGTDILRSLLVSEVIDFMRLSASEARRIPELVNLGRTSRRDAAKAVYKALSDVAQAEDVNVFPALSADRLPVTTQLFMDLIVGRFLMRALVGEDLKVLRAEIAQHVELSVAFFLAGCRQ